MDITHLKYFLQDAKHSIEVYNIKTDTKLHKPARIFQTYLDKNHNGSVEEYFKSLASKGIDKVQVQMMRKQGNTDVRYKVAKNLQISQTKPNAVNVGSGEASLAGPQQGSESHNNKTMETSTIGMGAEVKAFWFDKLDRENEQLKLEVKQLNKEIENKKDDINELRMKLNRPNIMDTLAEIAKSNPGLIEKVMPGGNGQQQLPQGMQGASAITNQLVAMIKENDLPDELVERLIYVAQIYAMNKGVLISQIQPAINIHVKELQKEQQNQQQNGTS